MPQTPPPPSSKPPCDREDAVAVLRRLRAAGHVAYFAGGCVRDELLGIKPKDYDVATDAPPQRVRELFSNTQAVGAAFGVILVRHHKSVIEVATFRSDGAYVDGRHPSNVHFTNAEEDAKRRDFTINGLFFDPIENKVIDYVGGQEDLRNRILRAIGEPGKRFEEDHLRLLRAIRFAARFELEIEATTAEAIRIQAKHLTRISPERIAEELRGTITLPAQHGDWARHALLEDFCGLAQVVFRFLDLPLSRANESEIGPWFETSQSFGLCLAALTLDWVLTHSPTRDLESLVKPGPIRQMTRAVRQALKISNQEVDQMSGTLEGMAIVLSATPLQIALAKRFLARPTADLTRALLNKYACIIGPPHVEQINVQLNSLSETDVAPPPLITGDDLTAAGLQPGKLFKRVLDEVYDAQLEGEISTKEQAMRQAMLIAQQK